MNFILSQPTKADAGLAEAKPAKYAGQITEQLMISFGYRLIQPDSGFCQ
jgi:hypothetical protein